MLERRMRKRPVLEAYGREGTTWLLAKPSIKTRDLLLWGGNFLEIIGSLHKLLL